MWFYQIDGICIYYVYKYTYNHINGKCNGFFSRFKINICIETILYLNVLKLQTTRPVDRGGEERYDSSRAQKNEGP